MRENDMKKHIMQMAEKDVPDLKQRIKADPRFELKKRRHWHELLKMRPLQTMSAALIIIALLFVGITTWTPELEAASTVHIHINPALEIDLDEDDAVIAIRAMNDDAQVILDHLGRQKGKDILDVLDLVIEQAIILEYLSDDEPLIMIDVVSAGESMRDHVMQRIESNIPAIAASRMPNLEMVPGNARDQTPDEIQRAREYGLSPMKLRLIDTILDEYPDTYEFDDLKALSIRELRTIISGQNQGTPGPPSNLFP